MRVWPPYLRLGCHNRERLTELRLVLVACDLWREVYVLRLLIR